MFLPDYEIYEKVHKTNGTLIYRGYAVSSKMPVLLKVLKAEKANPTGISKLIKECEITRDLDIEGVIKPVKIEKVGDTYALIMEDVGLVPLKEYIRGVPIDVSSFIDIAIQLAETVGEVHQNGLLLMELKTENIFFEPKAGKVKIADFSEAVLISEQRKSTSTLKSVLGNAAVIPNGQPVPVENVADYRSDYLSLGAVLYEVLTGAPVKGGGTDLIAPAAPPALSAIIMKMLSQIPEERYQSIYGLVKDLEECRRQWIKTGKIESFSPGQMDVSPRFELPRKLCGRDVEKQQLKTAFDRACKGKGGLILVNGYAGTGKTMLVNETLKPMSMEKGYFGYGKFDQLRKNIPYDPFSAALGSVIRQLMTENKEKLSSWRKRILRALGRSGAAITGWLPELEMIIGKQPAVEELQPKEAQNRFFMLFGNLIKVIAQKNHPLVIFLDDLQWADSSSLELIKYLCRDNGLNYLLLVGAYRSNEVNEEHPLFSALTEIRKDGAAVEEIYLGAFNSSECLEFTAAALHCPEEKVSALSELLYRKTCGIPFFLGQLLKLIYDDKLIIFNMKKGCWEWEEQSILKLHMPDDIAVFIFEKLESVPEDVQNVLKLASCIGNTFDLEMLSTVSEKTEVEIASLLQLAVREGLLLQVDKESKDLSSGFHSTYEFLHDIVRQGVYSLLSEKEKKKAHVKVGRLVLQNIDRYGLDDGRMMFILDHLNRGLDLVVDPVEKVKLAEFNLAAGRKAKASGAYDSAVKFFRAGMDLLPENCWNNNYNLCCNLYQERAQCEYLAGDAVVAEQLFDTIIQKMETEVERADIYSLKMALYAGTGKYDEAVQIGINALKCLGVELPVNPSMLDIAREVLVYKWQMRNKSIADLAELPEMQNVVQHKVAHLLIDLILAACTSHSNLYAYCIIKAGNHAVRYGLTDMSSIGYIGYSIIEGSLLGNPAVGHKLGKVAITLADRYGRSLSKCIVYFTFGSLISHWISHGREALLYLNKARRYAIEAGNVLVAGYCFTEILEIKYLMGTAVNEVLEEAQRCKNYARRMKHENLAINAVIYEHAATVLTGGLKNFSEALKDWNNHDHVKVTGGDKAALAGYYFTILQLCYLFGHSSEALAAAEKVKTCTDAIMGFMLSADIVFYHSLAMTAAFDEVSAKEKKKFRNILKKHQRKMKKWANYCPDNYLHKYLLVEAERLRISGKKQKAGELYDKAIRSAHDSGYVNIEAVACELAGQFYEAEGRNKISNAYLKDAFNLYRKWGADAKASQMSDKYPCFLDEVAAVKEEPMYDMVDIFKSVFLSPGDSEVGRKTGFDIGAVQEVIKNISEESNPEKLVKNFLELAVKSVGADKGYLILENNDELYIEAKKDCENIQLLVMKIPLEKVNSLAKQVVRYTARTLETVIIKDSKQAGIFARDPHIVDSGVKSLVSVPLQLQDIPVGVLYLESNHKHGIFTKERIAFLKFLAGQMIYAKTMQSFLEQTESEIKCKPPLPEVSLTEREKEVLQLIAEGLSNKEIADKLGMAVNTVKTHIKNIYGKLQVNRRVQVVTKAKELNLL